MKNERELLEEINENIRRLSGILAVQNFTEEEKIQTLKRMQFNSTEISQMTGIHVSKIKRLWNK